MLRQAIAEPAAWSWDMWAASLPMVTVIPVWGVALGVATWGYRRRRYAAERPHATT
jgi:hypothetical protein